MKLLLLIIVYVYTTKVWNDFCAQIRINEGAAQGCSGLPGIAIVSTPFGVE
jgi:hypothetical protein